MLGGGVGMDRLDRDVGESASLLLPVWSMQPAPNRTASIQKSCVDEPVKFLSGTQDSEEEHMAGRNQAARLTMGETSSRSKNVRVALRTLICASDPPQTISNFDIAILCEPAPSPAKGRLVQQTPAPAT